MERNAYGEPRKKQFETKNPKPMHIAETERLILREFTLADAADFYRIYTDAETMKFQGPLPDNYSVEVERYYLGKHIENYYETQGFGIWAVVLKENNRVIGRCGFVRQPLEAAEEIEITYLIEREFWNRGFASEAAGPAGARCRSAYARKAPLMI